MNSFSHDKQDFTIFAGQITVRMLMYKVQIM
jgi:hypothetical protein